MAEFTPRIPGSQDPNYLSYSRPISQPEPDNTLGNLFKGLGNLVDSGVKGIDTMFRERIDKSLEMKNVEREKETYTAALEHAKQTGEVPANILRKGGEAVEAAPQEVPGSIDSGLNNMQTVQNARDADKISPSYYYGRVAAIAKELRSRYPGYKDYIDSKVSSIIGTDPANAYIRSLTSDINAIASQSKGKSVVDDAIRLNMAEYYPGQAGRQASLRADPSPQNALRIMQQIEEHRRSNFDVKKTREGIELNEQWTKANKGEVTRTWTDFVYSTINGTLSDQENANGISRGLQQYAEIIREHQSPNGRKISPERAIEIANALEADKGMIMANLRKVGSEKNKAGGTIMSAVGDKEANEIVGRAMSTYDEIIGAIRQEKWGIAFDRINALKTRTEITQQGLMNHPELGNYFTMAPALRSLGGDQFATTVLNRAEGEKLASGLQRLLKADITEALVQPTYRASGRPTDVKTFSDTFERLKRSGVSDNELTKKLVEGIQYLSDPSLKANDDIKVNVAMYFFDPKNIGVFEKYNFNRDRTDPSGRPIPGRQSIFNSWTSAEVTKEIRRLDTKQPGLWNNYKDWVETTFGMDLYRQNIDDLNSVPTMNRLKLKWENGRIDVEAENPTDGNREQRRWMGTAVVPTSIRNTVNRMNMGLASLERIAKEEGRDPEAYVYNVLRAARYNPANTENPNSLGGSLQQSIDRWMEERLKEQGRKMQNQKRSDNTQTESDESTG